MNEYFNTTSGDYKVVHSFVTKCREVKLQILGKRPSSSFHYYKRMT